MSLNCVSQFLHVEFFVFSMSVIVDHDLGWVLDHQKASDFTVSSLGYCSLPEQFAVHSPFLMDTEFLSQQKTAADKSISECCSHSEERQPETSRSIKKKVSYTALRIWRVQVSVSYLWLSKLSANHRRCHICNIFSHWVRHWATANREWGQVSEMHNVSCFPLKLTEIVSQILYEFIINISWSEA